MYNKGDTIQLDKAKVLSVKDSYEYYNGMPRWHKRVMLEDPKHGKVWFKSASQFTNDLYKDQMLSCDLTVSGLGDRIIFGKSPQNPIVESNFSC